MNVELLAALVAITASSEVAVYSRAFTEIAKIAVYGDQARELIQSARNSVGNESACKTVQEH